MIEIKHRFTQNTLYACDAKTLKGAVEKAVKECANLTGANLTDADLTGANLRGADLEGADLEGANLAGANLEGAYLEGANLEGAYLEGANMAGANLAGANLAGANLDGEKLYIAPISVTNLDWPILISAEFMRIGCQRHSFEYWFTVSDVELDLMHPTAFRFWKNWGPTLLALFAKHRQEAFKSRGSDE